MKKIMLALVLIACLLLCTTVLAAEAPTLSLRGNATTGYDWQCVVADESVLTVTLGDYVLDDGAEGKVGVGGVVPVTFTGVKAGETTATFTYAQPWDVENSTICTLIYTLRVDDALDVTIVSGEFQQARSFSEGA